MTLAQIDNMVREIEKDNTAVEKYTDIVKKWANERTENYNIQYTEETAKQDFTYHCVQYGVNFSLDLEFIV